MKQYDTILVNITYYSWRSCRILDLPVVGVEAEGMNTFSPEIVIKTKIFSNNIWAFISKNMKFVVMCSKVSPELDAHGIALSFKQD